MNFDGLAFFRLVGRRLDWLSQRQNVLAQNIANADTPDYRPKDLRSFADYVGGDGGGKLQLAGTQPGHLTAASAGGGTARAETKRDVYEVAPSGNEVVLEQQLLAMNETASAHQTALNLYRKQMGMIRTAIGGHS